MTVKETFWAARRDNLVPTGARLSYSLLMGAAFVSTWTGVRVGALQPVDWILVAAGVAGIASVVQRAWAPRWVVLPAMAVALVYAIHAIVPTGPTYLASRFELIGLGAITGDSTKAPLTIVVQWLLALAVLPLLVRSVCVASNRTPTAIMWAWALGAAASALVGLSDYSGVTNVGEGLVGYVSSSGRQSGLTSHANNLGFSCTVAAPIAVHMLTRRKVLLGTGTLALLILGALVSGSRGSQVGVALAVVLSLVMVPAGRRALPIIAWFAVAAGTLVIAFAPGLFAGFSEVLRFGQVTSASESDSGRRMIAEQAIEDFRHSPVWGIGYEVLTQAHSIYLQFLAAGGVLLTAAMAYFFIGALTMSRRLARAGFGVAGFIGCSIIAWLVVGSIENQLTDRYLYFPVAALTGLAGLVSAPTTPPESVRRSVAIRQRMTS